MGAWNSEILSACGVLDTMHQEQQTFPIQVSMIRRQLQKQAPSVQRLSQAPARQQQAYMSQAPQILLPNTQKALLVTFFLVLAMLQRGKHCCSLLYFHGCACSFFDVVIHNGFQSQPLAVKTYGCVITSQGCFVPFDIFCADFRV